MLAVTQMIPMGHFFMKVNVHRIHIMPFEQHEAYLNIKHFIYEHSQWRLLMNHEGFLGSVVTLFILKCAVILKAEHVFIIRGLVKINYNLLLLSL